MTGSGTPVSASPLSLRTPTHDSGPQWIATPSPYDSFIHDTPPVLPAHSRMLNDYSREMQRRLQEKNIGYKREFLREIPKEVKVGGATVYLTYRLPMTVRTPLSEGKSPRTEEFFTLYQMVEPMGVEPTASRVRF